MAFRISNKERINIEKFAEEQRIPTATWMRKTILDKIAEESKNEY